MKKSRVFMFASVVAVSMAFGGVLGATVLAHNTLAAVQAAAPSPAPAFQSNETAAHEQGESAAQETAENNGTFHPGGGPNGMSNEASAHEAGETAAEEASEKS